MKYLKYLLIAFAIFLSLPFIIGLFVDKNINVEREIVINQPKEVVFDFVSNLRNQPKYSKWAKMDPNAKLTFTGNDGEVGSVYTWESTNKNVGKGAQEITAIKQGERIDFELRFIEPFETTDQAYMITEAVSDNQTKVKWGFSSEMKYPMNFMLLFWNMDKMVGADFQEGLDNLKVLMEE